VKLSECTRTYKSARAPREAGSDVPGEERRAVKKMEERHHVK